VSEREKVKRVSERSELNLSGVKPQIYRFLHGPLKKGVKTGMLGESVKYHS
jgi:hypothetical protein